MRFLTIFLLFGFSLTCIKGGFAQQVETGMASFYNDKLQGRLTASGEVYDTINMTAAHRSLPFFTKIKVTNIDNKKSVIVIINDRGPFVEQRIVDLSKAAAKELNFIEKGLVKVQLEVVDQ
jgi:rare lipoprotein A